MNTQDSNALEALRLYLDDFKVVDIDVEPKGEGAGFSITAKRKDGRVAFSSWGQSITSAVEAMVRSSKRGQRA